MKIYTIGFTKKNARCFFSLLKQSGAKRIVDVRLNNVSQLAGFAKMDDLSYFAQELCDMDYLHLPAFAPTKEILDDYKKNGSDWGFYEKRFMALMKQRRIEDDRNRAIVEDGCLLCSEDQPKYCHRRLVAEYLKDAWGDVEIIHLV